MNAEQVVCILKALMTAPSSRLDLARQANVTAKAVGRLLVEMKEHKMIYVIGYTNETDGRNRVKLYVFGDGEDAQPKETQPQKDRSRKSYLKKVQAKNAFTPMTTFAGGVSPWQ